MQRPSVSWAPIYLLTHRFIFPHLVGPNPPSLPSSQHHQHVFIRTNITTIATFFFSPTPPSPPSPVLLRYLWALLLHLCDTPPPPTFLPLAYFPFWFAFFRVLLCLHSRSLYHWRSPLRHTSLARFPLCCLGRIFSSHHCCFGLPFCAAATDYDMGRPSFFPFSTAMC